MHEPLNFKKTASIMRTTPAICISTAVSLTPASLFPCTLVGYDPMPHKCTDVGAISVAQLMNIDECCHLADQEMGTGCINGPPDLTPAGSDGLCILWRTHLRGQPELPQLQCFFPAMCHNRSGANPSKHGFICNAVEMLATGQRLHWKHLKTR